jgi:hypothetical protein
LRDEKVKLAKMAGRRKDTGFIFYTKIKILWISF